MSLTQFTSCKHYSVIIYRLQDVNNKKATQLVTSFDGAWIITLYLVPVVVHLITHGSKID
ncbi:hypothetical protein GEA64_14490 [Photorhabdus khanii]|uniref:Uncharacterized protein n=2 Tax=Photorhabdus khanii TaxID=1004150 RepID=A0A7C9GKS0_9GAMM|nr:hypothetical protein [Photorhabdus khanii]MQL49097.1 hypothetical protein [Photorhabdus khanii]